MDEPANNNNTSDGMLESIQIDHHLMVLIFITVTLAKVFRTLSPKINEVVSVQLQARHIYIYIYIYIQNTSTDDNTIIL